MTHLPLLLACAVLLAGPVRAQEEEEQEESAPAEATTEAAAPEAPAAPVRRAGQPFRPGARKASPAPAPASGGSGGGSAPASAPGDGDGQSLGGAGLSRFSTEGRERLSGGGNAPAAAPGGAGEGGDGSFQVIDIGLLPTISQVTGARSGGDRPVVHLAGGKKWAIRLQHKGSGRANFNILLGGTNGNLTGGGKYRYRAAISRAKGSVSGSGALCPGEMHNAAYVTCRQPCSMSWDLRFGTPAKDRRKDTCELDHGQIYYLNVAPEGNGCSGGEAEGFGCPLVMEVSNGGTLYLNPGGVAAACAHRGFGSDGNSCR